MTYNLGWGHSRAVREAFLETHDGDLIIFSHNTLKDYDYPNYDGDKELLEITKDVIERQVGKRYNHVFLTNGATGAINIALQYYKNKNYQYAHTRKAPYYVKYPDLIKSNGMFHEDENDYFFRDKSIILLDLPSNPLGLITSINTGFDIPTILDGVYLNKVYLNTQIPLPKHNIMIGSYSKLTGLNGARIGWIAMDSDIMAERIKYLTMVNYCGMDMSGARVMTNLLNRFDWDSFEFKAKRYLDYNREELSKLSKFFGNALVPEIGMFYYFPLDRKARKLLEKANVTWTSGRDLGVNDNFARLNVGASVETVEKAVKTILKLDKI